MRTKDELLYNLLRLGLSEEGVIVFSADDFVESEDQGEEVEETNY